MLSTEKQWVDYYFQRCLDDIQKEINTGIIPEKVYSILELYGYTDPGNFGGFNEELHATRCKELKQKNGWNILGKVQEKLDDHLKENPTTKKE